MNLGQTTHGMKSKYEIRNTVIKIPESQIIFPIDFTNESFIYFFCCERSQSVLASFLLDEISAGVA